MRKAMKALMLVTIAACQLGFGELFAAERTASPYLPWESSDMPIVYYLNAEGAATWLEETGAIIRSFLSWERVAGTRVRFQYAGVTDKKNAEDDGQNVVTWVGEDWPYGSDTVAFAVVWLSRDGERISGVDLLLNAEDFAWATDGNRHAMDVQNVTTHEVGHALGLDHSVTSTDVTMFPVIAPGETRKRRINEEEQWILRALYPSGRTRADTYAFLEGELRSEKAIIGYPPADGDGRLFLLTRVDADGDGLDEVGAIQEEDGALAFYLFSALTSGVPSSEPLAYDAWSIPEGQTPVDMTAVDVDGDGKEEIGILRAENDGHYAFYIFDAPTPLSFTEEEAPALVKKLTLSVPPGDNLVAAMGVDYDGDGIDEVAAVRLTPQARYFLDIYDLDGNTGESSSSLKAPSLSISLPVNLGFVDLDISNTDADEDWELVVLSKDSRGWNLSSFDLPDSDSPPEERNASLADMASLPLPAAHNPMHISSLRIRTSEGSARPAVCILMAEGM